MKKWLLYIMSFTLNVLFYSCTTEMDIPETPSIEGEVKVSFVLNTSSSRAIGNGELDDGFYWERYIDPTDIRVFVFTADDKYQEEITRFILDGTDGDATRTFTGTMKSAYTGKQIQLVVLTNMRNRGVTNSITLVAGKTTKKELYGQLVFKYDTAWSFSENEKNYIPMWGISKKFSIQAELNNAGQIDMYRAVAKIDIQVNGGDGIDGFKRKKLELYNVPDCGYCASLETPNEDNTIQFETPSLPKSMKAIETAIQVFESVEGEDRKIENKIYVPEMGSFNPYPYFKIQIYATVNNKERTYDLYMRENQIDLLSGLEIIRNHKYIINIETITATDEVKMVYNVNTWGEGTNVDIPFN